MNRQATTLIVVHVSATAPGMDIGAKEIGAMHRARGWSQIGYHRVIRRDGTVEGGRAINSIGAHVAGHNSRSVGVCLVGGVNSAGQPQHNATPAQMAALEAELRALVKRYPAAVICGHRDLSPDRDRDGVIEPHEHIKACPCFDVIPWAAHRGLPVAPIKGEWTLYSMGARADVAADADEARIAWLQRLLTRAGYPLGPVDGIMGRKTRAAIRAFQAQAALVQTGEFDGVTVARLRAMSEPERPAEAAAAQPVATLPAPPLPQPPFGHGRLSPQEPAQPPTQPERVTADDGRWPRFRAALAAIFTRLFGSNQGEKPK